MLKRLVETSVSKRSKRIRVSPGQMQLTFGFDLRLNQIPDDWHQIAVRFRRANGIRDSDSERSIWWLRWGNRCISRAKKCSGLALLWVEIFGIYFEREERLRIGGIGGRWSQVLEGIFGILGVIDLIKAPMVAGAFAKEYKLMLVAGARVGNLHPCHMSSAHYTLYIQPNFY